MNEIPLSLYREMERELEIPYISHVDMTDALAVGYRE